MVFSSSSSSEESGRFLGTAPAPPHARNCSSARNSRRCACTRRDRRNPTLTCRSEITCANRAMVWARLAIRTSACPRICSTSSLTISARTGDGTSTKRSVDAGSFSLRMALNLLFAIQVRKTASSNALRSAFASSNSGFFLRLSPSASVFLTPSYLTNGYISTAKTSNGSSTAIATASVR
jgi:hypothetical protein